MKGVMLCGFSLDELVAVAKLLKENPELLNDLKEGYRLGYEQGRKEAFDEIERAANRAIKRTSFDEFPFVSTDGGIDLQSLNIRAESCNVKEEDKPF